ncbi:MAG: hypothetical protein WDN49_18215 [Acetobacteraceae bacterium]
MVGNYSHYDRLFPGHVVAKAAQPSALQRAPQEAAITYTYRQEPHTLQDYLARNPATGLLIARDDTILFEHYQYGGPTATGSCRNPWQRRSSRA